MKQLAVINLHSTVDLITNSSSELFVVDSTKSVEAIKSALTKIAALYNAQNALSYEVGESDTMGYQLNLDTLFTNVFREPTVSKYTFDVDEFPDAKLYREIVPFRGEFLCGRDDDEKNPILLAARDKMNRWRQKNPQPKYTEGEDTPYSRWWKDERVMSEKVFADWNRHVCKVFRNLHLWAAQVNGVDISMLGELQSWGGDCVSPYYPPTRDAYVEKNGEPNDPKLVEADNFINEIEEARSWEYTLKKGNILLRSANDNSIPYEMWPMIENVFSCQRRHLG